MKTAELNSYIELTKFMASLRDSVKALNLHISDTFIVLVGCNAIGIDHKHLSGYKWRANHYLQEALKVSAIPTLNEINNLEKNLSGKELSNIEDLSKHLQSKLNVSTNKHSVKPINNGMKFKAIINQVTKLLLHALRQDNTIMDVGKMFTVKQKKEFNDKGYLIIPNILDRNMVGQLSKLTLHIAKNEIQAGIAYKYGGENNALQRIYNLISKHPVYVELLELPIIREILEFYFKRETLHFRYNLSSFQSNIVHPGGPAQQLHVDGWGVVVKPLPPWPVRLNINFTLTDWTKNNGSTFVSPGSHKLLRAPEPEEVQESELTKVIAPKGSIVIWPGHLWHKSGRNNSNKARFGLFACFAASHLKEVSGEEEHLLVVDKKVMDVLSPEMKFMIGLGRGVKKGAGHRVDFKDTEFEEMTLHGNVSG
jgi:hypothetical protein